jgi:hypothetical protein
MSRINEVVRTAILHVSLHLLITNVQLLIKEYFIVSWRHLIVVGPMQQCGMRYQTGV